MALVQGLKSVVPPGARAWARELRQYRVAAVAWRSLLEAEAPERFRPVDPGPIPPAEVVSKTALMRADDLEYKRRARVFLGTGMKAMADFVRAAVAAGLDLGRAEAALELGSGGARLVRHLRSVEGLRLAGSDLIEDNARWCAGNVGGVEFHTNELTPPLAFAADASFDFAFAYSVFTHVPMDLQGPWIAELARVLRPGGVATVTVLGPDMAQKMMTPEEYASFASLGEATLGPDHPRVSESSRLIGSWDVFMTADRVREIYGEHLEVVSQSPGAQSIVTLRRRP